MSPATVHATGLLTAASDSPSPSSGRTVSTEAATPTVAPPEEAMSRMRSATTGSASSISITPARQAAVYSPSECPIRASGRTPSSIRVRASAYSVTNSAMKAAVLPGSTSSNRAVRRSEPRAGRRRAEQWSTVSR